MDMTRKQEDELSEEHKQLKREHYKVLKEFQYLKTTDNIVLDFTLAQAKEICKYFHRLSIAPLYGWKKFLVDSIDRDRIGFLEGFYLIENEYGVLEPDYERINKLRIK